MNDRVPTHFHFKSPYFSRLKFLNISVGSRPYLTKMVHRALFSPLYW